MKVSVVLCCYNGSAYVRETIESVLNQSFDDFEVCAFDDASSDDTFSILTSYAEKDARIRLHRNPKNLGIGQTLSLAIHSAQAEYVAQIGHDDVWEKDHLARTVQYLDRHPSSSVVFSAVRVIDGQGRDLHLPQMFAVERANRMSQLDLGCELVKRNGLCGPSSVLRKSLLQDCAYLEDNDQLQDWQMWQHLIFKGPFGCIPEPLVCYRVHGANLSIGGSYVMQTIVDADHCRFLMFSSPAFAKFILQQNSPEQALEKFVSAYISSASVGFSEQMRFLLLALRVHLGSLGHLETYRHVMGYLYWSQGALSKAPRFLPSLNASQTLWSLFLPQGRWSLYIFRSRKSGPANPFQRVVFKGSGLQMGWVFVSCGRLPRVILSVTRASFSPLQILESHIKAHRQTLFELGQIAMARVVEKFFRKRETRA